LPLLNVVLVLLEQPGRFRQYSNVKLLLPPPAYIIKISILSHEVLQKYNRSAVMNDSISANAWILQFLYHTPPSVSFDGGGGGGRR